MLSTGDGYTVLGDDIVSCGAVSLCTTIRGARQANDFAFPPSFGGHGACGPAAPCQFSNACATNALIMRR